MRLKFRVVSKSLTAGKRTAVLLHPVGSSKKADDVASHALNQAGHVQLELTADSELFAVGKEVYLDISPAV